jgi:hypothetical protein
MDRDLEPPKPRKQKQPSFALRQPWKVPLGSVSSYYDCKHYCGRRPSVSPLSLYGSSGPGLQLSDVRCRGDHPAVHYPYGTLSKRIGVSRNAAKKMPDTYCVSSSCPSPARAARRSGVSRASIVTTGRHTTYLHANDSGNALEALRHQSVMWAEARQQLQLIPLYSLISRVSDAAQSTITNADGVMLGGRTAASYGQSPVSGARRRHYSSYFIGSFSNLNNYRQLN